MLSAPDPIASKSFVVVEAFYWYLWLHWSPSAINRDSSLIAEAWSFLWSLDSAFDWSN